MSDEIGMPPPAYPAGWYPSHTAPGRQEYWDGSRWTGAYAPEPPQHVFPPPPTAQAVPSASVRTMGISTWIGIGLVSLWLIISLASGGVPAALINGGVVILVTALYVVITGRRSWMRLKGRKFGAILAGAALLVTFTGAGIVPREPTTDVVALVDSSESMDPQSSATSAPAPQATTSASPTPKATPTATPTPTPTATKPLVVTKKVTETQAVDFTVTTVDNASLAAGTTQVVTPGQPGKRTVVYSVTYTDGVETGRMLLTETVTVQPVAQVVANGTYVAPPPPAPVPLVAEPPAGGGCDSNYDPCVPIASDVDCAGGSGNGPAYVSGPVYVIGTDVYELDRDGDGIACD